MKELGTQNTRLKFSENLAWKSFNFLTEKSLSFSRKAEPPLALKSRRFLPSPGCPNTALRKTIHHYVSRTREFGTEKSFFFSQKAGLCNTYI